MPKSRKAIRPTTPKGHGTEAFIDATQNLLFTNAFRWVVSTDPAGDPFEK